MMNSLSLLNSTSSMLDRIDENAALRIEAAGLFGRRLRKGQGGWLPMLRRRPALRTLADAPQSSNQRYLGMQLVPLSSIHGTENRAEEFDGDFNPASEHLEARWVSVAVAHLRGVGLPPVELIKVGEDYYVRDGHHRISVAHAFGQTVINALVTEWA